MAKFNKQKYELDLAIWTEEKNTVYSRSHDGLGIKDYRSRINPSSNGKADRFWLVAFILLFLISAIVTGFVVAITAMHSAPIIWTEVLEVFLYIFGFFAIVFFLMGIDKRLWDYWFYLNRMDSYRSESKKTSPAVFCGLAVLCFVAGWYKEWIPKNISIAIALIAYIVWRRISFGREKDKYYEDFVPKPKVEDYISDGE